MLEKYSSVPIDFANSRLIPQMRRAYNVDMNGQTAEFIDLLSTFGLSPKESLFSQIKSHPTGERDIMITSLNCGYLIKDDSQATGMRKLPDRLIVNADEGKQLRYYSRILREVLKGTVNYELFDNGNYGVVGMQPHIKGLHLDDICVKYFNYAYPYSKERWDEIVQTRAKKKEGAWNLSAVTGAGNYIALRYLGMAGIRVPKVFAATSEILIQEFIPGYTLADIFENYESLKSEGVLGSDNKIMDGIFDFEGEIVNKASEIAEEALEPIRHTYWTPDFEHYDINWGNIMIRKDGLHDPWNNYYVIDPLR